MALQAKNYKSEPSHLQIVKNEQEKKTNLLLIIGVLMFIITAIVSIRFFLNSADDKQTTKILTESGIDWNNPPCSPNELNEDWIEITPETMQQNSNRREFKNKNTGLEIAFDKGIPGKPGFRGKDHWHIYNPFRLTVRDYYLDKNGNKIHKNDDDSHIEIKCN